MHTLKSNSRNSEAPQLLDVKIVPFAPEFIPMYQTAGSAAVDLVANIQTTFNNERKIQIPPGHTVSVDVGFHMELPPGWEAQIRSRSGLASEDIVVVNSPGTIDSDYRGPVMVLLKNLSKNRIFELRDRVRVAQMTFHPVNRVAWKVVEKLSETARADGGFGSTDSV